MKYLTTILLTLITAPLAAADLSHLRGTNEHAFVVVRDEFTGGYYDLGQWAVLRWQIEGDERRDHAVAAAVTTITEFGASATTTAKGGAGYGWTSEIGLPVMWLYEQVKDELTDADRQLCFAGLRTIRDTMLESTRPGDSDIELRNYFTLRLIARALGDKPEDYRFSVHYNGTLADAREWIDRWIAVCEGGEAVAGSAYNVSELGYAFGGVLLLGEQGRQEFPGMVRLAQQAGWQQIWSITASRQEHGENPFNGIIEYSDVQPWGGYRNVHRLPLFLQIIELGGDPECPATEWASGLPAGCVLDLYTELSRRTTYAAWQLGFYKGLAYLPRELPANPARHNPQGLRFAPHVGLGIYRHGDDLLQFHIPQQHAAYDHFVDYACVGSIRFWCGKTKHWLLNHPIYYMPHASDCNAPLAGGFGRFWGGLTGEPGHGLTSIERTATGFRALGWTGGDLSGPWHAVHPPPWLRRMERAIEWNHATRQLTLNDSWSFFVRPTEANLLAKLDKERFAAKPGLCWQPISTATRPTQTADGFAWTSAGGVPVELKTTAPAHTIDEHAWRSLYPHTGAAYRLNLIDDRHEIDGGPASFTTTIDLSGSGPPVEEPPPPPGSGATEIPQFWTGDGKSSILLSPSLFPAVWSFETWLRTDGSGVILGQTADGGQPGKPPPSYVPLIHVGTDGHLYATTAWRGSNQRRIKSPAKVNDGEWHHVAVTPGKLFIDGELAGEQTDPVVQYAPAYSYFLGTGFTAQWPGGNGGWHYFEGTIQRTAIHKLALTAEQVAALYAAGVELPGPGPEPEPEPPAADKIDEVLSLLRQILDNQRKAAEAVK